MTPKPTSDDLKLWWLNTRDVTPLGEDIKRPSSDKKKKQQQTPSPSSPPSSLPVAPQAQFQRKSRQALRKQRSQAKLDLHGHTHDQAWNELLSFIISSREKGHRTVLVITGKGSLSSERTLRIFVPRWLEEPVFSQHITGFQQAPPREGGTGALYLYLKKKA